MKKTLCFALFFALSVGVVQLNVLNNTVSLNTSTLDLESLFNKGLANGESGGNGSCSVAYQLHTKQYSQCGVSSETIRYSGGCFGNSGTCYQGNTTITYSYNSSCKVVGVQNQGPGFDSSNC